MARRRLDGGWFVPPEAFHADAIARERGRVRMLNGALEGGMEDWTMPLEQWLLVRQAIRDALEELADADGVVALKDVIAYTQERLEKHPAFPGGRLKNFTTYTKVDLEARGEVVRVPNSSPQRIRAGEWDAWG